METFQNISLVHHDQGQQSQGTKVISADCHIAQREGEADSADREHPLQVSAHWEKPQTAVDGPQNVLFRGGGNRRSEKKE